MKVVVCKCGRRREVAGPLPGNTSGAVLLSALFSLLDVVDLTACGWSRDPDGRWRCLYCTRRARLMRPIEGGKREPWPKACNVTDPSPPTGERG